MTSAGMSRHFRLLIAAVLLTVSCITDTISAAAETPAESARIILTDSRYQSDLPRPPPLDQSMDPAEPEESPWREENATKNDNTRTPGSDSSSSGNGPWIMLAVLGVVAAALLGYLFFRFSRSGLSVQAVSKPKRKADKKSDQRRPAANAPLATPTILDEADSLAAVGRYSEAIHLLLLSGLEHAGRIAHKRIPQALTGREILRILPMADGRADALSTLVGLSERGHFGGRALSAGDYKSSRETFELFAAESARGS